MADYLDQFGRGGLNEHIDIDRLTEEIGLDEEEIDWRKEFIDFDEDDARRLESFADVFEDHADEIADSFYEHLTDYEQTRAVFERSPKGIDELKRTQQAYLLSLAQGEYDQEYFQNRARIGKLHELLDMPMNHYIGQYNVYYGLLLGLVTDRIHDRLSETVETICERDGTAERDAADGELIDVDPERLTRRLYADVETGIDELHSLLKLLNLDMQVAVDTYLQSRLNDIELERDRFAALFENVPTPVVVVRTVDGGMYVEQVNTAFEKLFGYTAEDLADTHFEQYLTPPGEEPRRLEDRSIVESVRDETESEISEAEVTLETQFGRREFIRVAAPVDRPDIDDLEYAFYIDVTDQKQRQERLQVLSRVLRHDLRNKMNVIMSTAELLRKQNGDEEYEECLDQIERSANELFGISQQVRRVEQLVAGDADHHPIDVTTVVENAFTEVREEYPDCEFTLSTAGETWVNSAGALDIAVEEIVENAAKHNDADDPEVEVSVTESLDGQYVDVRVADNGPGIPPSEYEVLTGKRDRTQTDHASGIGLWTVNWIVTRAGGALQFSANCPRGSIVKLQLPYTTPPE